MRLDLSRSPDENAELLHYAFACGINYFDTAPDYCENQGEEIFGRAFRTMRGNFFVATKGMPTDNDTADKSRRAVETSLRRLGISKIHFYHVWCLRNMSHYELAMRKGGQYEGLLRCREEGLIDHIVFSSHQPGHEIKRIVQEGRMEGVLLGLNILNFPYRWDGLVAAHAAGVGVAVMNPLGGGVIPRHAVQLGFLGKNGETPTEAALRFNFSLPQVTVTLVGFARREEIDFACRLVNAAQPFSAGEIAAVRSRLSVSMNRLCTGCGYCAGCPERIPIPGYMLFYNEKVAFGASDEQMRAKLKDEYEWGLVVGHEGAAARCTECGWCEDKCTQHLDIRKRLNEIRQWEQDIVSGRSS